MIEQMNVQTITAGPVRNLARHLSCSELLILEYFKALAAVLSYGFSTLAGCESRAASSIIPTHPIRPGVHNVHGYPIHRGSS